MCDETSKKSIDLDALVDTLVKEKEKRSVPEPVLEESVPQIITSVTDEEVASEPASVQSVKDADSDVAEEYPLPLITTTDEFDAEYRKKSFGLFGHRKKRKSSRQHVEAYEDEWADWNLTPIGHGGAEPIQPEQESFDEELESPAELDNETVAPRGAELTQQADEQPKESAAIDEFPSITPVAETITLTIPKVNAGEDSPTKVIPAVQTPAEVPPETLSTDNQSEDEQLPDQLSIEEMVRVEDMENAEEPTEDVSAAERFQQSRMEKIRDFTFNGIEEEENEPEEEPEDELEEEPIIEDFSSYEDTRAVGLELQYRARTSLLSLVVTSVLFAVSLVLTLISLYLGESPITAIGFISAQVFTLLLIAVLNFGTVSHGLSGLFSFKANADSFPAFTVTLAIVGAASHFANLDEGLPLWATLAGLPMVFAALAQYVRVVRIRHNFQFVAYDGEKFTAALIQDEKPLREIGHQVSVNGQARVAYFHRSKFLKDFLANSYDEDVSDVFSRWFAPIVVGAVLCVSGVLAIVGTVSGFWEWLLAFVVLLCMAAVPASLATQCVMLQCCRHMLRHGGFAVGWKAVKEFGKPDALIVDAADLFPDESMLLHGIKTFAGMQIDEAILYAASLSIRSGGPLSLIFRRIIEDKTDLLRDVENLVYEQGMGLSGWVNGNRIFLGNRRLLSNHGVDVPSADYEARYAKNGRRLVYLSMNGNLSAMFVVSYLPNETIRAVLSDLCRAKITILVRSCDQNIAAADLCTCFDLDEYYVEVLPASAGRLYDQMAAEITEESPAIMASNGHIVGTSEALSACRSVLIKSRIALTVTVICAALSLLVGIIWTLNGLAAYILLPLVFMLVSALLVLLTPVFRRI